MNELEEARQASANTKFGCLRGTIRFLGVYWKGIFAVIWAIVPLAIALAFDSSEARCGYVMMLMAGYWVTECIPIAVTSMLPVVLLPVLGILGTQETCSCYMNDTIMVFIGGLILAIATEHSNLHLRIALAVMSMLGCSHAKLLGGLCTVTTFVSMWIANAAAIAMMVPIVFAVLYELEKQGIGRVFEEKSQVSSDHPEVNAANQVQRPTKITQAYLFAAAYSSTFGGTGTLVGTPTNLAFKGIYESTFPDAEPITFGRWIVASFPQMCVNSFLLWLFLCVAFLGYLRPRSIEARMSAIGEEGERVANEVIRQKLKDLGPMTFHEICVGSLFASCVFLWIFRAPGFVEGWAELITGTVLADSVPAMLACFLMFVIPKEPRCLYACNKDPSKRPRRSSEGLMTWETIQRKMPWSLVFLLGGGFAVSKATRVSGLAMQIGKALIPLKNLPSALMLFIVLLFVNTLTEFTSNVGTANIILPVVAHMCVAMKVHPLYVMVPVALMCSYAFRLPVSTPPNAIITVAGHLPSKILFVVGCVPSFYTLMVQIIFFPSWGAWIYGIKEFPTWAENIRAPNAI